MRFKLDATVQVRGDVDAIAAQLANVKAANADLDLVFDEAVAQGKINVMGGV